MKKNIILTLLILLTPLFFGYSQENSKNKTTYILLRHSEKDLSDPTNKNPNLTKEGKNRSENIAKTLMDVSVDYIFSTNYHRTLQTAAPIAKSKNIETILYDPRDLYNKEFQEKTKGKTSVIVGHSNTTPAFVNKIISKNTYDQLDEKEYSKLFIVHIIGDEISDMVLHVD